MFDDARRTRVLFASAATVALVGCAVSQSGTAPGPSSTRAAATDYLARTDFAECLGHGTFSRGTSAVARYAPGTSDSIRHADRLIAGPHTGLCWPGAVAIGPKGELYVVNRAPGNYSSAALGDRWVSWMTVYDSAANGDAAPVRTLDLSTEGLDGPGSLTVDRAGLVYATSGVKQYLDSGSVTVFEAGVDGDVEPLRIIAGPNTGLRQPAEIAIDGGGNLYITNERRGFPDGDVEDTVRVFAASSVGDVRPTRTIAGVLTGLYRPSGLAFDRNGRLYVANAGASTITVYDAGASGSVTPLRTITGRWVSDRMGEPRRVAFDSHDSLYVRSTRNLTVFAPGLTDTTGPKRTFSRNAPDLFSFDAHDTLYALVGDTVKVYPPGYAGVGTPIRTIGGPSTGIRRVTRVAVDNRGWLYLAVGDSSIIRVYSPGASGDTEPSRTISGARTRLRNPKGIAVDGAGRLYITNGPRPGGGGAVRVYAAGARGEDPPIRTLMGPDTRLSRLTDIELDSRGNIYVSSIAQDLPGEVSIFRSLADGNEAPLRTIVGPTTLLRSPSAIAFGRGDTLYALNAFGRVSGVIGPLSGLRSFGNVAIPITNATITVYPPGARDDADPVRYITLVQDGKAPGQTKIGALRGLAADTTGAIHVWDRTGELIYPPGASGAVVPARVLLDPGPKGGDPAGVTADAAGTVYQAMDPSQPLRGFIR